MAANTGRAALTGGNGRLPIRLIDHRKIKELNDDSFSRAVPRGDVIIRRGMNNHSINVIHVHHVLSS